MRIEQLDAWARRNHGLITLGSSGLTRSAWYRAIRAGVLEQIHPLVARLHGTPHTTEQAIAAAVLATGGDGLASHRSAAHLWGIPRHDRDRVDLILPQRGHRRHLEGVDVHRPRDMRRLAPSRRRRIACTNLLRTLVDLGAVDPEGVSTAVGHALGAGLVDLGALETTAAQHSARGRPGTRALRAAIDEWSIDAQPADSLLEVAMTRLIARYGLPPVEFHPVIEGCEVDSRVIGTPLILECDGWTYHGLNRIAFERDRESDAQLSAAGWIVIRFTYRAITRSPRTTAERIRRNLSRWSNLVAPDAS